MSRTVQQVIDTALGLAQLDSGFQPTARLYYNLILEKFIADYDFPYYQKTQSPVNWTVGVTTYDLPNDYSRSDHCWVVDGNGNRGTEVLIVGKGRFRIGASRSGSGAPRMAYIDKSQRKIVFECVPTTGGFELDYFRLPTDIDTEGGDDEDTIDFDDPQALIQELTSWLMKYRDDQRQPQQAAEAKMSLRDSKLNSFDEDSDSKVELASSVYKPGRRSGRGGGGGFPFGGA